MFKGKHTTGHAYINIHTKNTYDGKKNSTELEDLFLPGSVFIAIL